MIERRSLDSLGGANHGWLDAKHHFSFADYHDPKRMHWGSLRVWNDDAIQPGSGFPPHSHGDMEIITYVRQGAITHEDNLGNKGRTPAGDVQVMSAGSGITHAEYNLEPGVTRIFQIWIIPDRRGEKPSWGSQAFPKGDRAGAFVTLASGMAGDHDVLPLRTDARVLGATIQAGDSVEYHFAHADRYGYLVLATGAASVNGVDLRQQDGAAIHGETRIRITASEDTEVVLVDAAPLP
ncbi:pirin family protein [Comamonas sp. CMM03]|uniref:pirin family protein n=1 Tax=Comamonas sp. CMM03 TaxID=2854781 RepID=UPI001C479AC5|nr:pirin family protein [Comamonas sp. CMM03]MBV7418282.1 pirin family protein [Comamonas sp. CMM03]